MVESRLNLELEVQQIFQLIDQGRNFLLSGGAGSGKTYSLVSVINQAITENPTDKIACMTYTNAAVKEIEERVNHKNLNVTTTIHDFLWDNIKHFQKELKQAIISLANDENIKKISIDGENPLSNDFFDHLEGGIQYKEFVRMKEGIISHDELLIIANYLFDKYPKLCSIVKDKYKFIFIDEYQDTSEGVVEIFLTHFKKSNKKNIIGFFGDAMQSIYDDGIGNLDRYKGVDESTVNEVLKKQNRRNPQLVINLANKLRTDHIKQEPSTDRNAPNMMESIVKQGKILFLYSKNDDTDIAKRFLKEKENWNFDKNEVSSTSIKEIKTKELNLTHNLIAEKAEFKNLMDIYDKDPIIGLKSDILSKIKENKKNKPEIAITEDDTFENVVDKFKLKNRSKKLKKDVLLMNTITAQLYNQLKDKPFSVVRKIYLDKDALIDDKKQNEDDENKKGSKRDNLIKHVYKIQTNIRLYQDKKYNDFLRVTDFRFKIEKISDKKTLKENIESLVNVGDKTIEEVINFAHEKGICLIDDKFNSFKEKNEYLYNRVKTVKFSEFQKLYDYLEGKTPFSTQHKTKGAEFDNVLVVLDNGNWNDYNFNYLFNEENIRQRFIDGKSKTKSKLESLPRVLNRTQKIFYVCCTRAKENLAVFFHNPDEEVVAKAKEWFGDYNVLDLGVVHR